MQDIFCKQKALKKSRFICLISKAGLCCSSERRHVLSLFNERLRYLYSVCRGTLSDVVRNTPDIQSVFDGKVSSDTSYVNLIGSRCASCERIYIIFGIILYYDFR